jgi:hypothetical protein
MRIRRVKNYLERPTFVYRGSSLGRKSAACPKFDMGWLNLSPIPVGKRGIIPSCKDFYLSSLHVEEGGRGQRRMPCDPDPNLDEPFSLLMR